MTMGRALLLTAVLLSALLGGCAGSSESAAGGNEAEHGAAAEPAAGAAEPEAAAQDQAGAAGGEAAEGGAEGGAAVDPTLVAEIDTRIVRDGTMRVELATDSFDRAFSQVVSFAERFGGTVLSSTSTADDDGATSGSVTVRVPAEDYDALLTAVGRIGTVRNREITSEDVSAEFVDLEARLRHNEAQERFYLRLLDDAKDVEDAIAVQQRVEAIQQAIEQIKGRLRFLEDRTSYSRLTVELFEVGAPILQAQGRPSLAAYWATARDALTTAVGATLVVLTVAVPFALVGLVIYAVIRRATATARRTA
jgi:hypothetical protein